MIHGAPSSELELIAARALGDWTNGCIAVENHEMDEIWRRIDVGTMIEIRP
jgi:murein L,D-transpeptidase YafK